MRIDPARLWEAIRLGEDSDLELKEVGFKRGKVSAPRRDDLADECAAFANAGGGRLVLGVSDDRLPQSLEPPQLDALMEMVSAVCSDSIKPALDYQAYRVPTPAGDGGGVVVEISARDTLHRSPGGYYRRRGEAKRQMSSDEIRRLLQLRGQSDAAATDM